MIAAHVITIAACGGDEDAAPDLAPLEQAATAQRGTPEGVEAARRWAEAAHDAEDALAELEARQFLEEAAQDETLRCVAQGALAALEVAPADRYRETYRAVRGGCDSLQSALDELAAHRPSNEDLAAIDEAFRAELPACVLERVATFGASETSIRVVAYLGGECEVSLPQGASDETYEVAMTRLESESVPASFDVGEGGLARVRWTPDEALFLDLSEGARVHAYELPSRLIFDVRTDASVEEAAATQQRVIVLDPGHGGVEHGARYEELEESDLVLDISLRVARILRRRLPASRVVLTRERDEVVSLDQRAAFANAASADLFVSVHLNAADGPVSTGGVTTFVLDASDDEQAIRLAARENGTRRSEVTGIQRLIARLHRREQVTHSRRLAELVHEHTLAGGRRVLPALPDRGVKSALFYVLIGVRMPAILLEASFLTKREEAEALRRPEYREALASGVAEGLVRYVAEIE